jgi:hypothetical protein
VPSHGDVHEEVAPELLPAELVESKDELGLRMMAESDMFRVISETGHWHYQ